MTTLTEAEMKANLERLESAYEECVGRPMEKIFRFPEGRFNERTLKIAKELGYKTVFWSLAYADWDNEKQPNPENAKRILLDHTHDGAIILLHPTSSTNAEILGGLIKEWKKLGYRFGDIRDIAI
jgi:peptidoglycan-N-acetylmuramic acid deacetylase